MSEKTVNARSGSSSSRSAPFVVALARAAWVQVVEGGRYERMASRQHRETIEIPAAGRSTTGRASRSRSMAGDDGLRGSAERRRADEGSSQGGRGARARPGRALSGPARPVEALRLRPAEGRPREGEDAAADGRRRLRLLPEERRSYPQGASRRTCSGFAGTDNRGLDGLEGSLDKTLAGRPGFEIVVRDPAGRAIDVVTSRRERAGRNVVLTLDHQLQASAEQILSNAVARWRAAARRRS